MTVYELFGINDADFYNIMLDKDNRKFLDPYIIELHTGHPVAKRATQIAIDFFETIRQLIISGKEEKVREMFNIYMSEPNETCLGLSEVSVHGKGVKSLGDYIVDNLIQDGMGLLKAITRIEDIKLFMPYIRNDRVSDIYTNIIRKALIDYTQDQCNKYEIQMELKTSGYYWDINTHSFIKSKELMLVYNGTSKLLVPNFFVTNGRYNTERFINYQILPHYISLELNKTESAIVRNRKDGTPYVTKKDMRKKLSTNHIRLDKYRATEFVIANPQSIAEFKRQLHESYIQKTMTK